MVEGINKKQIKSTLAEGDREFKVGDKVFDIMRQEWGEVIINDCTACYPVFVKFSDNELEQYTLDGRILDTFKCQQLFHYNPDEIVDWDGKEELRVNHRVNIDLERFNAPVTNPVVVEFIVDNGIDLVVRELSNSQQWMTLKEYIKPILPKPKKIDHSSLEGSYVDVIAHIDKQELPQILPAGNTISLDDIQRIRMNHWMLLTDKQIDAIPEGYAIDYGVVADTSCHKLRPVVIKGIKEGWEL